jgi:hypothetical protein
MFGAVPIEYGGDVGCGDVFQPIAEKLHGHIPEKLSTDGTGDADRIAAKAQVREVYGVLAQKVIAHKHVGETPPCERVWCGWCSVSHLASPLLRLHVRVKTRHVHAERHLAKAGVASVKGRGISHPCSAGAAGTERAKRSGGLHKRSAEDWGDPLTRAGGGAP